MTEDLKKIIDAADKISITAHIGPDGDSIASSLLLFQILKLNCPDKQLQLVMEEEAKDLNFLDGYGDITFGDLSGELNNFQPNLLIMLDANTIDRVSRNPDKVRQYLAANQVKLAIIDHHLAVNIEPNDIYINNDSPAVTLDIYELFIEQLGLKKPDNYAQTAMTGIYTDTGGFINRNLNFKKTFEVVPKLIEDGANIELIVANLSKVSAAGLRIFSELIANTNSSLDYTYSYLSDATTSHLTKDDVEFVRQGSDIYRSQFLRNVEGRPWGFLVYRDLLASELTYSVSFRAIADTVDVSKIAAALGGGGHKPAAGAKIKAASLEQAITKIQQAIEHSLKS